MLEGYSDFLLVFIWWVSTFPHVLNLLGENLGLVKRDLVSSFPQSHKSSYIKNWVIKCWTSLGLGSLGILLFMGSNETDLEAHSSSSGEPQFQKEGFTSEKQYGGKGETSSKGD